MKKYVLSAAAEVDLESIWGYIAQDSIDAANHWISKLYDEFEAIERAPGMIVAITQGARDIPSFLHKRSM